MSEFAVAPGYSLGGAVDVVLGARADADGAAPPAGDADAWWMRRALRCATGAGERASPNPTVGCVIVKDGALLATGATERYGGRHAERCAIDAAGDRARLRGATLYTTLEPCAHWGRQPPCADLVAACGFARCVVGLRDPHWRVAGQGLARVRAAGTEVVTGVSRREVLAWHLAYLLPHLQARPLLTALGTEADGAGLDGAGAWERSDASRAYRRWLRHRSDATLADASPAVLARVRADGAGQPVIVWDVEGRLDAAPPGRRRALADTLEALAVPTALCHRGGPGARAVAELCSRRGVTCLAMPGGVDPVDWLTSQLRAGPLARLLGERRSWVLAADHPAAAARLLARGALDAAHLVRTEAAGPPAAGGRGAGPAMSLVSAHDLGGVRLREYYAPPLLSALRELSG